MGTSWVEVGPLRAFDQQLTIRTTDAALAAFLTEVYGAMAARAALVGDRPPAGSAVYTLVPPADGSPGEVRRDDEVIGSSDRPHRVLGYLVWAINRQVIERSLDRMILHAACAAVDDAAVLLPAPMESGKSTLVTGLVERGMAYLTDEAAAVGPDLRVEGYPKPISLDPGSWDVFPGLRPAVPDELSPYLTRQWQVPADRLSTVATDVPLGLVIFPRYEAGAAPRLERLGPADTVRTAVPCTFAPDGERLGADRIRQLAVIAEAVPAYRMVAGDLDTACELVERTLRAVLEGREPAEVVGAAGG